MNKTFKIIVSLLLTLTIMMSLTVSLDLSAFASEETETTVPSFDPEIEKITGLKKPQQFTDKIELVWNPVEDADGYVVYMRNSDQSNEFEEVANVYEPEVSVTNLDHTTPYQFKVAAYKKIEGQVYEGESAYMETATNPAATKAPSIKRSSSVISFSWNRNNRADGYVVYRASTKTGGAWQKYKTISGNTTTTYEDKNVEYGKSYFYMVKAYRTPYEGRTYYGAGDRLKAVAGLSAPGLASCTSQLSRVSLVWNKNKLAQGYYVYYSTSKSGPFTLLKDTKNTWFNTVRLENNKKYYFRIVPYRTNGNHKITGTWLATEKTVTNKAYGKNIGKTYIEISIKQQRMWYYVDGKMYAETAVVTGNNGYYSTPKGAYKVMSKASPAQLVGPTWSVPVSFWMQFTSSGCGIHDSTWRSSKEYGGTTYMGNGSHGCVNTPYNIVKKIYSKAKVGTHVVVY